MIARAKQLHDRVEAGHATGERKAVASVLQRGDISLERFARGILAARVLIPFILPESLLHVRRGEVHRRHDRSGQWLRTLAGVYGAGAESRGQIFVEDARHDGTRDLEGVRKLTVPSIGCN